MSKEKYLTALGEVVRLRGIIAAAYGSQGWDIGSMKNVLYPGLTGPLLPQVDNAPARTPEPEPWAPPFHTENYGLNFAREASSDHWWLELELVGVSTADIRAVLSLNDKEALMLADLLTEKVHEGRNRYNE